MSLKIYTGPASITIADNDNNRITILRKKTSIEAFTQVSNVRVSTHFIAIRKTVEDHLKKLVAAGDRDNYKIRFGKLAKAIKATQAKTFSTLNTSLQKELA